MPAPLDGLYRPTGGGPARAAFGVSMVGRVNAGPVGPHPPETLLVASPDCVRVRSTGWNHFPHPGGGLCRVADRAANPPHPPAAFTEADLVGVVLVRDELAEPAEPAGPADDAAPG